MASGDVGTESDSAEPNCNEETQTASDVKEEPPKKRRRGGIPIREENKENGEEGGLIFPAQNVFEYQWPQDEREGEWYFVQEQITEYLGVTSFKRKYPDIERRVMLGKEKDFLRERGVVTEEQVTLGLTALKSDDIYDLMMKEYPDKYNDYIKVMREKEQQSIKERKKAYSKPIMDEDKKREFLKKAAKQASEYNRMFMKERREERAYYFDMQTLTVQMPANKMKKIAPEYSKPGPYPVALIPGQFQNYYRNFTSEELKYFPLNTALYGPSSPRRQDHYAHSTGEPDVASDDGSIPVSLSGDDSTCLDSISSSSGGSDSDSSDEEAGGEQGDDVDGEGKDLPLPLQPPKSEGREVPIDEQPKPQGYMPKKLPDAVCGLCLKDKSENKQGEPEDLVHCSQCDNSGHPSCLDMTEALVKVILSYPWQCMECKTCMHCGDPTHEDKMMFCDDCDRGYHTFCVGLKDIPTGKWACDSCTTTTPTTNSTTVTLAAAELPMEQASLEPIQDTTTTTNSSTEPESTAATESEATAPESSAPESATEPAADVTPTKPIKRRGRPPGSKNKPKDPDASPKEKKTPKEKKDKKEKKEGGTPVSTKKGLNKNAQDSDASYESDTEKHVKSKEHIESSSDDEKDQVDRSKRRLSKKLSQTPSCETPSSRSSRNNSAKKTTQENQAGNSTIVQETGSPDLSSSAKRRRGRPPKKAVQSDGIADGSLTPDSSIKSPTGRLRGRPPKVEKETPTSARKDEVETEASGGYQGSPLLLKALQPRASTPKEDVKSAELQLEEIAIETEPLVGSLSRPSKPSSAIGNEMRVSSEGTDMSTPLVKRGRGRPRKDRSVQISDESEAKKRKTDTPTPDGTNTPEKVNEESEIEDPSSNTGDEETATDSPSVQEEKVPLEGETPAKSKVAEGQDTPTPKRRGRPPKKDKDKDTPTPSAKKGRKPRKKVDTEDGDKAETSDSTPSTPLTGTPRAGTPVTGTPKAGDGDGTPVAPKRRGRPPKNKDSPAAPAPKRAKKQLQEDTADPSTPSIPQVDRLQADTPVDSPATSNQDSESVITGTEAPSESSSEQTPDITPSPTPDCQNAPTVATPAVNQSCDTTQKTVVPPSESSQGRGSTDSDVIPQTAPTAAPSAVPMDQDRLAASGDAAEPMQVSEAPMAELIKLPCVSTSPETPAVPAEQVPSEPTAS